MKNTIMIMTFMLFGFACATMQTLTPQEVRDLTNCSNITLKEVENNLFDAGYPIRRRTDNYIQTDYFQVYQTNAFQSVFVGQVRVMIRLNVRKTSNGVHWAAFSKLDTDNSNPHLQDGSEKKWDVSRARRQEVEILRKSVCGS